MEDDSNSSCASDEDSDSQNIETFDYEPSDDENLLSEDWTTIVPRKRKEMRDMVTRTPGPTADSKKVTSIREAFDLFFTHKVKQLMITHRIKEGRIDIQMSGLTSMRQNRTHF